MNNANKLCIIDNIHFKTEAVIGTYHQQSCLTYMIWSAFSFYNVYKNKSSLKKKNLAIYFQKYM